MDNALVMGNSNTYKQRLVLLLKIVVQIDLNS